MQTEFPFSFDLENTHVIVNKTGTHEYRFLLQPKEGSEQQFVYNDEEVMTEEKEKAMPFDHLNALRGFWLETRNEE